MMIPIDQSLLSAEHDDLVAGLYGLRDRLKALTTDERLILEAAIMMTEYLTERAQTIPDDQFLSMSPDQIKAREEWEAARSKYPIHWTIDDFERLICSGGFELDEGRLVPRF